MSSPRREGSPFLATVAAAGVVVFAATAQFGRSGARPESPRPATTQEPDAPTAPAAPARAAGATDEPSPGRAARLAQDEGSIHWVSAEEGFAEAARTRKPVMAVFTATWCGQCRTYRENVLTNPEVVAASRDFVMVQVDIDQEPEVARRHAPDGGYVPRTLFFTPDGDHRAELRAMRPNFQYFLEPRAPTELLTLMARASNG